MRIKARALADGLEMNLCRSYKFDLRVRGCRSDAKVD